jgi:long-chain acyl-CoA synthetase
MTEPRTLPQLLAHRAAQNPDAICQRHKYRGVWKPYSWSDVLRQVRELALGLYALGMKPGETVAVIGENEPEHFWAELAAQAVGGKVVSLYPDLTPDEVQYILDDSEAVYLVAQDQEQVDKALAILERTPALRAVIYWDDTGMWSYDHKVLRTLEAVQAMGRAAEAKDPGLFDRLVASGKGEDIAVLSYTSGTTGRPKGVVITHNYLFDNAHRVLDAIELRPGMEYLTYIAPAWVTEQIFGVAIGLMTPLVVNFPEGPDQVLANIRELAVEVMLFGPRQWESLAATVQARMLDAGKLRRSLFDWGLEIGRQVNVNRLDGKPVPLAARILFPIAERLILRKLRDQLGMPRLKIALAGGSTMAPDVFRLFHAMGVPLRNIYGVTEVGLLTVHQGARYDLETVGHWMRCRPDFGAAIEWQVSPEGQLLVRGGSFFQGYYRKPDRSTERLQDGWYRTGDAVTVTQGGELVFLERMDDMRRLRNGHGFPPQFIETRLRFSPFIKDIMILGDERRDFIAALVNIDAGVVGRWAEERNLGFSTFFDLSQKPEVAELIRGEIRRINTFLPEHSRVARFANFPKELDPDEGELTRTRKLRREFLEQRYAALIESLYGEDDAVTIEVPVTYQDGRRSMLSARVVLNDVEPSSRPRTVRAAAAPIRPREAAL